MSRKRECKFMLRVAIFINIAIFTIFREVYVSAYNEKFYRFRRLSESNEFS